MSKNQTMSRTATTENAVNKGLDALVHQAMTDGQFLEALQHEPEITLKKHGYPATEAVITKLKTIDFNGLRAAFQRESSAVIAYC